MKWFLICYCVVSLMGCQYLPASFEEKEPLIPDPVVNETEQTMIYGMNFAKEYKESPGDTCKKYKELFQQGSWRAGWVLALYVNEKNVKSCLNNKEAVAVLLALESEKKIHAELIWVSQYHWRLLQKLQQKTKKISQLKRAIRKNKQEIKDLKKLNQEQLEKLDALKAIATSINNE